jgi:GNAT superfamily N-acetyltransferase
MKTYDETAEGIRYQLANSEDRDELVRCVQATFPAPHGEVMARVLGIGAPEYLAYTELVCDKAVRDGMTTIAKTPAGSIAGFCIAQDFATAPHYREHRIHPKFQPLISLLETLDQQYREGNRVAPGKVFHLYLLGVEREFSGRGLALNLVERSLNRARELGFSSGLAEATGVASQALVARLGFATVGRVNYADFLFEGQPVFHAITAPAACLLVEKTGLTRPDDKLRK